MNRFVNPNIQINFRLQALVLISILRVLVVTWRYRSSGQTE